MEAILIAGSARVGDPPPAEADNPATQAEAKKSENLAPVARPAAISGPEHGASGPSTEGTK